MLAPHAKQRNAMVDFGGFPEPPAGVRATVALDALEKLPVIARGRPQCHSACNFDPLSWGIGVQN